jgi:hypothetical protein
MNGQDFERLVHDAFSFLGDFDFILDELSVSGLMYHASFVSLSNVISVSYEPGNNNVLILVHTLTSGRLSDIDDRSKTPRLTDLNRQFMKMITKADRASNEAVFKSVVVHDHEETLLLKAAKELRLVLPRYLASSVPLN